MIITLQGVGVEWGVAGSEPSLSVWLSLCVFVVGPLKSITLGNFVSFHFLSFFLFLLFFFFTLGTVHYVVIVVTPDVLTSCS